MIERKWASKQVRFDIKSYISKVNIKYAKQKGKHWSRQRNNNFGWLHNQNK